MIDEIKMYAIFLGFALFMGVAMTIIFGKRW